LRESRKLFNILMPAQSALFWNTKHWPIDLWRWCLFLVLTKSTDKFVSQFSWLFTINYLGCELSLDGESDFDKKNKQISRNMRHYQKELTENPYRYPNDIL